jgi:Tat protein translocase TatB subunit
LNIFEILVVAAIALVVIGPERLPEVLRALGKILRELRAASNEVMRELTEAVDEDPRRVPPTTSEQDQIGSERHTPAKPPPPTGQT